MALRLRGIGTTTGDDFVGEHVIDAGQVLRIGRALENDWVIADPTCQVSKRHCAITHQDGRFVLKDLSTNGVFVDDEPVPVGRDAMRPLADGQKLQIGVYRFAVDIDLAEAIPAPAPASVVSASSAVSVSSILDGMLVHAAEAIGQPSPDWLASVPAGGFAKASAARPLGWDSPPEFRPPTMAAPEVGPSQFADRAEHSAAIHAMVRLPNSKQTLPSDWNEPSTTLASESEGNVALLRPAAEPADHVGARRRPVAAFLEGAGLPGDALDGMNQEIALREAGRMLRVAVEEARTLLAFASCFESEFGITTPGTARDSVLESAADARSAIKAMMAPPRPHSASGEATMSDGFARIATHEMALVAAIGNALTRISSTLDPTLVRTRSDGGGVPLFAGRQKARYWDALEAGYAALRSDTVSGETLAEIASQLFADAYVGQTRKADR